MTHTPVNLQRALGHQVLAAAGKTILRPGGRAATEQLFQWANFRPDECVLELAASFGDSAIALAKRFGVRVVGVEKNPESVAKARAKIQEAGLEDRVQIIEGDIFHLETISGQFDYVLAEAILSMQPAAGKAKVLREIQQKLKAGGQFLSHELLAKAHETEIHQDLAGTIRSNTTPISKSNWIMAFEAAGLQVQQHQTGKMGLLNLAQMIRDEGILSTTKLLWNILKNPQIRQRVLAMRSVFNKHKQDLGYIILSAKA